MILTLSSPPLDIHGQVLPHDHPCIKNTHSVIRRVSDHWKIHDPKINGFRLTSLAFRVSGGQNGGMSVDLYDHIQAAGINPIDHIKNPKWIAAIILNVGSVRASTFLVGYHPTRNNQFHGEIWGTINKKTEIALRNASQWLVPMNESVSI